MAISSINFQVATKHSKSHMMRISKTTYLIDPHSKENEYKSYLFPDDFLEKAKLLAKEKTKRSMQKLAIDNFVQEAVLNLNEHHSLSDVEQVFKDLKAEFGGFEVFDIAVHKDEGYFYNIEEKLEYRPNADIFYNEKDKQFYLNKELTNIANMDLFEKRYNYHSHILFTKFDKEKGKNAQLKRADMRKIQTIVSKSLGMQRGEEFSKAKRQNHWQLKQQADIKRSVKKEHQEEINKVLIKQKELKAEIKKLKEELQEQGATRADYAQLEELNRDLKAKIKAKELTRAELRESFNKLKEELIQEKEEIQNKLIEARETILEQKTTIDTLESDLKASEQREVVLNNTNKVLKVENKFLYNAFQVIANWINFKDNEKNKGKWVNNLIDALKTRLLGDAIPPQEAIETSKPLEENANDELDEIMKKINKPKRHR